MKQCISVDISKAELVCRHGMLTTDHIVRLLERAAFPNDSQGIRKMHQWACKQKIDNAMCVFVMEATGVYHENLAFYLYEQQELVSVELPQRAKRFAQSLGQKSKTDAIDADKLCQMGLERNLTLWGPPNPIFRQLRGLSRELNSIKASQTRLRNQLSALHSSHDPEKQTLRRLGQRLRFEEKMESEIEEALRRIVRADAQLQRKVEMIETMPAVGFRTIITVLAETDGFAMIRNRKQLASFAGLDVVLNQSGQSMGRTRISKKGNHHLRKALFMPAMSAIQWNPEIKAMHQQIKERSGVPMKGVIAGARKLLLLIYALWKNDQAYQSSFRNVQKT